MVPQPVRADVQPGKPLQRVTVRQIGGRVDEVARCVLVSGDGAVRRVEVDRLVFVVVDPKVQCAAVREGKRRNAQPHAAGRFEQFAQPAQHPMTHGAAVDPRNLLGNVQPGDIPLVSLGLLVEHFLEGVTVRPAAQAVDVDGLLSVDRRWAGAAPRIEQHEPPGRRRFAAVTQRNPLLRKHPNEPRRDVVQDQRQERKSVLGHRSGWIGG